ncbi:serine hydrolase [Streptomyces sp. SYSU K21746]
MRGGRPPAQSKAPARPEHTKPAQVLPGNPVKQAPPAPTDLNKVLSRSLERIERIRTRSGTQVSVAVLDPDDDRRAVYGSHTHVTASIVKVDILAALLLHAQRERRPLTRWETSTAASMIQSSDNTATSALWRRIGGGRGLDDANEAIGLTATEAGPGVNWGLTRTTAADQLTLLSAVFSSPSPLTRASRSLVQELMGDIDGDQDWGVSAAGGHWALKNGWLLRPNSQRWAINSMGRVRAYGNTFYLAILSHGSRSMSHGISVVEQAARSAVHVLSSTPPPVSPLIR